MYTMFFILAQDISSQIMEYFHLSLVFCISAMKGLGAFPYLVSGILHIHLLMASIDAMTKSLLVRDRPRLYVYCILLISYPGWK